MSLSPAAVPSGIALLIPILLASPAAFAAASAAAPADDAARIGTIEATLNGKASTWYVHDRGDVPGATWIPQGPGRYSTVITGFESRGRRVEGSQLTVSFEFLNGETAVEYQVSGRDRGPAAVNLLPSVDDIEELHTLDDGVVRADLIELDDRGTYRFSGTFSGTLTDAAGNVVGALTSGTFRVEHAVRAEPPAEASQPQSQAR